MFKVQISYYLFFLVTVNYAVRFSINCNTDIQTAEHSLNHNSTSEAPVLLNSDCTSLIALLLYETSDEPPDTHFSVSSTMDSG